ncbi:MAG: gliding motility-associated ABC transporter substrate-binding protein GldG [Flavobacteriales bacterium]
MKETKKRSRRSSDLFRFAMLLVIVAAVNLIGSFRFARLDLTAEKRFTLSDSTKNMLRNLDDVVYVQCYLEGDLNADFKKMRNATREMLDEFKAYAGVNLQYDFINVFADAESSTREKASHDLMSRGLAPFVVNESSADGSSVITVFPGALVSYKGKTVPVNFMKSQARRAPEAVFKEAMEGLEAAFSQSIFVLKTINQRKMVAFAYGHGELNEIQSLYFRDQLKELYYVKPVKISSDLNSIPKEAQVLIVAKPDSVFDEGSKFVIDQFVMKGGRVLWLMDNIYFPSDSARSGFRLGLPVNLNLDDLFFKYGFRVNYDLLNDAQCGKIMLPRQQAGQQGVEYRPWVFFPSMTPNPESIITAGIGNVKMEYAGSIDTLQAAGVTKTVLLHTSDMSRAPKVPIRLTPQIAFMEPSPAVFNRKHIPGALLLEGTFTSVFENRLAPRENMPAQFAPVFRSEPTKMIVASDGDLAMNYFDPQGRENFPPGAYPQTGEYFGGNLKFLLNSVNYLMDDTWLIPLRSKEFKVRLLDTKRLKSQQTYWQWMNTLAPIGGLLLFGLLFHFYRRYRFAK